jgi:hypothetical protein
VVDKPSIGGIPGNRTSLIVAPIVAAHGLSIPKTSSRAITSPAGTADTMEVLARVDLNADEMRTVVECCGGCIVWGGRVNLSPANDVMISVERPLGIDTAEQMAASIMSKKVSAGSSHLAIDMPVGATAKIRDNASALRLRKLFEYVAWRMGVSIEIVATDGSRLIGRGVGPVLETRDVLAVLDSRADAPRDLLDKSVMLAGKLLEIDLRVAGGRDEDRARELIASGDARRKLDQIIEAQGPSPPNWVRSPTRSPPDGQDESKPSTVCASPQSRGWPPPWARPIAPSPCIVSSTARPCCWCGRRRPTASSSIGLSSVLTPSSDLLLAADALRRAGARRLILVAPYLCYLRRDAVFAPGEPLSRDVIPPFVGRAFDAVVTVQAHLHRTKDLSSVLGIPVENLLPTEALAAALPTYDILPLVIGPDQESSPRVDAWIRQLGGEGLPAQDAPRRPEH